MAGPENVSNCLQCLWTFLLSEGSLRLQPNNTRLSTKGISNWPCQHFFRHNPFPKHRALQRTPVSPLSGTHLGPGLEMCPQSLFSYTLKKVFVTRLCHGRLKAENKDV